MIAIATIRTPETDEQRIAREARLDVAEDMAWELIGTCTSIAIVADRIGVDLDDDLEASVLNRAFQCHGCGWWHSVEELNNLTERELCDGCHLEENPADDFGTPIAELEPMPKGGTDMSAVMEAVMRPDAPTVMMIVTEVEQDPIERIRLARASQETNPGIDVVFAHVG